MKIPFGKRELTILSGVLLFAFIIRFIFFPYYGYKNDTDTFAYWFNTAASNGPRVFYTVVYASQGWVDYPPFNVYLFWGFGSIANALSLSGSSLISYIIKLPPNLFDMATAFLIFAFVRKRSAFKMALSATALYAFNPAVIFNAAIWGQFDAIYTFFLILSLFLLFESKPKLAVVAFMLGVLTKPQSIALAPLMVFLIYRKYNWKGLFSSILLAAATVFAVIIPFEWSNPVTFLSKIYFGAYQGYSYTTVNAFNVWAFGGIWVAETQLSFLLGWAMFASVAVFALYFVHKRFDVSDELVILFAAFLLFFGFFMLPTRIHERYLFPAMAVMALMVPFLKKIRPLYVVLAATCFVNQAYVLYWLNAYANAGYSYGPNLSGDPVVIIVSLINLIAFVYVLILMVMELRGKKWLSPKIIQAPIKTPPGSKENENTECS